MLKCRVFPPSRRPSRRGPVVTFFSFSHVWGLPISIVERPRTSSSHQLRPSLRFLPPRPPFPAMTCVATLTLRTFQNNVWGLASCGKAYLACLTSFWYLFLWAFPRELLFFFSCSAQLEAIYSIVTSDTHPICYCTNTVQCTVCMHCVHALSACMLE